MKKLTLSVMAALCLTALGAHAQDDAPKPSKEDCTMACDDQSDACMSEADGDSKKVKACDDTYSECLARCG